MTRQDAIELLVNATYSEEWQGNEQLAKAQHMAIDALEQEPIIRCKECKFNLGKYKCFNPNTVFLFPDDDDYCSYAERKESDEE